MAELSPMMKQYKSIKEENQDAILLFRLGDFYEMFFEDAILASRELELTLTGRDCGLDERAPMCGVPYHSIDGYLARLVKKGYKVAICEQVSDPDSSKGLVLRQVVRVVTPGTVIENSILDESKNNYIMSIWICGNSCGVSCADISTGESYIVDFSGKDFIQKLMNEIARFVPSEIIACSDIRDCPDVLLFIKNKIGCSLETVEYSSYEESKKHILTHFDKQSEIELSLDERKNAVISMGRLLTYLYDTQKAGVSRLTGLTALDQNQYVSLDITARRNLELVETFRDRERKGSLLWVLDETKTSMGKRLIRSYVENPLINPVKILNRLGAVSELHKDNNRLGDIIEVLGNIFDIQRLMTKLVYATANARDLLSLCQTTRQLPTLKQCLNGVNSPLLLETANKIDILDDITFLLESAINDDPPLSIKEGNIIKTGYNSEVDELRDILKNSKNYLADIEAKERERTGIKTLKISYSKIFGYCIEVTRSYLSFVPEDYIRKQTLANCERYVTEELKILEQKIMSANEKINNIEFELFDQLRKTVVFNLHRIQRTAQAVAMLDVFCSFALVARKNDYCCPDITIDEKLNIFEGRHPVVQKVLSDGYFVPNDTILDCGENQIAIITGPNMAGKSTYMRQTALIVLMAQMGSFVPAKSASIGIVDKVFTRVGASDDIASGQSTFMVEMSEVAQIIKNATKKSLIILDEIGRGTSTFDGMSIAKAVVEYIADKKKLGAKTLFATHYHELTEMENELSCVKNYNIAVKKRGDEITFLRRIVRGGADDSYGIEVAKLAGVNNDIVNRAKEILKGLEASSQSSNISIKAKVDNNEDLQTSLLSGGNPLYTQVCERIIHTDFQILTPIESMNLLFELSNILK